MYLSLHTARPDRLLGDAIFLPILDSIQVKIKEIRRGDDGSVVVIKEYNHPSTGSFWDNAQDAVRTNDCALRCDTRYAIASLHFLIILFSEKYVLVSR